MNWRFALTLWALGVAAALSLLAAPMETLQPASMHFSPLAFRALSLVNPLVIVTAMVALGCWLAPKVGLDAPLIRAAIERRPILPVLRRQAGPAVVVGILTALVLLGYGWLTAPWFAAAKDLPDLAMPLVTKLLYGGVVEELMTRWGLMSLFVWVAWRLGGRAQPVPRWAYPAGAGAAALLFAAGHLPLLYAIMPAPPARMIVAVLIGNAIPGLLFGWLFWRRGLEAAMLAHALGHLLSTLALPG